MVTDMLTDGSNLMIYPNVCCALSIQVNLYIFTPAQANRIEYGQPYKIVLYISYILSVYWICYLSRSTVRRSHVWGRSGVPEWSSVLFEMTSIEDDDSLALIGLAFRKKKAKKVV